MPLLRGSLHLWKLGMNGAPFGKDAAYQNHRATPHFKAYLEKTADLLAGKQAIAITPSLLANKGGLNYAAE